MPSGAKKRKAAKKKLRNTANNSDKVTNFDGSNSLGNDNDKSHDERESDVGEVERESSEEPVLNNNTEGQDVDVPVNGETNNGKHKRSSSSSSSSSSEENEVVIENEKPEVVEDTEEFTETIPVEESVKNVVSFPNESSLENESGSAENRVENYVIESEMKENLDEVVPSVDERENVSSGVNNFVENIETKVIQVVSEGSEKLLGDMATRDGEGSVPQSFDNHVEELETKKYVEEKPLMYSAPLPVQRTSWTGCCGLFEVFSGGASR